MMENQVNSNPSRTWITALLSGTAGMALAVLIIVVISGCASKQVSSYYADDYLAALDTRQGVADSAIQDAGVERFANTLGDFTQTDLGEKIAALYADELYFNDTFKTFQSLDTLQPYLEETGEMVAVSEVQVLSHVNDGQDTYVRWLMDLEFSAAGKDIKSRSLGMTQLRFNADGEVILHQDFWDGADGFYTHLPIVGGFVHRVREGL